MGIRSSQLVFVRVGTQYGYQIEPGGLREIKLVQSMGFRSNQASSAAGPCLLVRIVIQLCVLLHIHAHINAGFA